MHPSSRYVAHIEQSSSPVKAFGYIGGGLVEAGNWKIEAIELFLFLYYLFGFCLVVVSEEIEMHGPRVFHWCGAFLHYLAFISIPGCVSGFSVTRVKVEGVVATMK